MFKICLNKEHSSVWQKCHNVDWTGLGLGLTGMVSSNNMRQEKYLKIYCYSYKFHIFSKNAVLFEKELYYLFGFGLVAAY